MSIENFKNAETPANLSDLEAERLEATKQIMDLALKTSSRSGAVAARLIFSVNNGLPFSVQDLVAFDFSNRWAAKIILLSMEPHDLDVQVWLNQGGYAGNNAYWAIRDKWSELFDSLRKANAVIGG